MKICVIANARAVHTRRWCEAFAEHGHDVHLLSIRAAELTGVTVHTVCVGSPNDERPLPSLASYVRLFLEARHRLRAIDPDLVNAHFTITHGVIAAAANVRPLVQTTWGRDVVWDGAGDMPRWRARALRFAFRRADAVLATSKFMVRSFGHLVPDGTPLQQVPFGVDPERFCPAESPRQDGPLRVGFVKTLRVKYGPRVLIRAFARVREELPDVELVMAGRGPLREACEALIRDLGLEDAVRLIGFVPHEDVPELLRSFDVLVNASVDDSETFGVVIIEASATGVPVVATRVGGVAEACVHEQTGLMIERDDVHALADALLRLLRDRALRERLGRQGRQYVLDNYVWQDNVNEVLDLFASLTDADPAPGSASK